MSVSGKTSKGRRRSAASVLAGSAFLSWPLWWLEASALAAVWFVSRWLPVETAALAGQRLLRFIGPRLRRQRHVQRNLTLALPNRSAPEIEALTREVWGSFGAVVAEYAHLPAICRRGGDERIELVAKADLDIFRQPGKPVIFVGAHLANWELCAAPAASRGVPLTVVYTPESNPLIARMLQKRRQALGCGFVSKSEGLRPLMRELSNGRSIGLLVDRRIDRGETIPFFGLGASMTATPARLALKFGCQLIPARVERTGRSRFRVTLYPPVEPDDDGASDYEKALQMTLKVHALFEDWIERRPQEWFCSKRIWPKGELVREPRALEPVGVGQEPPSE